VSEPPLPPTFVRAILDVHGSGARSWLDALPGLLSAAARRWHLSLGAIIEPLTYGYLRHAAGPDGPVILKAAPPGGETTTEIAALAHFDGAGAARLLEADPETGVFLLEALVPGDPLLDVEDETATRAVADVIRRLHGRATPPATTISPFPSTESWSRGFARVRASLAGEGPLPATAIDRAERLSGELHADASPSIVLHGDLHHRNVLAASRDRWLAVDPKGVTGEPAYETGAWLRNPAPELLAFDDLNDRLARRVAIFSEMLGHDPARIAAWGYTQAVLSALWSIEDHGRGWEASMRCAGALRPWLR